MIEIAMGFAMGFLAASLLIVIAVPFVHARAVRLTTRATVWSVSRRGATFPCRSTARKSGPAASPAAASQSWVARTGQVWGRAPYGRATWRPTPSWSVSDLARRCRCRE